MGYLDINLDNLSSGGGGGGGVTSLNGETGAVNLVAGTNIAITPSGNNITIDVTGGAGSVVDVTGTSPIFSSGGTSPDISIQQANTTDDGYLSSTDWNTFNSKQTAGSYITSLTGDATASGPGAATLTLATIATPGTFPKIIFNAKGQVLAGTFLSSGDIPNNTANTTGTASNITATSNSTLTTLSSLALPASQITGVLPVSHGGTGQSSFTDGQLLIGDTTGNTLVPSTLTAGAGIAITNGSGTITVSTTGTGTTPGGANQSVQFNNSGIFDGFGTWNGTLLTVAGDANFHNVLYTSNSNNDVVITPTSNANQNISIGSGVTSSTQSVGIGYQANAGSTATAIGYQANANTSGTAVGTSANGSSGGVAVGQLSNGSTDGVAIGFNATSGGVAGSVAIGGATTGSQAAKITGFTFPTVQIGAGTAVLDGGLNFGTGPGGTTYGIFDRTGKFHGDGSLLTNLPNQVTIGHVVGSGTPNAVLYVDASGNLADNSAFLTDSLGNVSGLSFTASGTPGFVGDGSGLTGIITAPGGTTGQLQYNNAGVLAGDTGTTDGSGNFTLTSLLLGSTLTVNGITSLDTGAILTNGTGTVTIAQSVVVGSTNGIIAISGQNGTSSPELHSVQNYWIINGDGSASFANNLFAIDNAGNVLGNSFTAIGTPGFIGDGSGLTGLPSIPSGTPNTFAGFDGSGNLQTITNWTITSEFGVQLSTQVDELNQNFNQFTVDVVPTTPTTGLYRNIFQIGSHLDPTNTGIMMGDNTGGGVTLIDLAIDHTSSGEVGQINVVNGFSNLGDGTTSGHLNNFSGFTYGSHAYNAYTIDNYVGVASYPTFDVGSTLGSLNGIQINGQYNGTATGFVSSISAFAAFGATSTTAHYHAIENGVNGTAGAVVTEYLGNNTYMNNVSGDSYTGYNLNANNLSYNSYTGFQLNGGTVTVANTATGINIDMGSTITSATNIVGLNLDMGGSTSANPIMGLQVNEGASNIFYTQNIQNYTGGAPQIGHIIGGTLQATTGNPAASPFIFNIIANSNVLIQDNVGPNPAFPELGVVGFAVGGQIGVLSGITIDTYTEYGSVKECPAFAGDGGTIGTYNFFNASGIVNAGGNLVIDNVFAYKVASGFSSYATTSWGVYVGDTLANNYFAKNVVIGGGTGLSAGGYNLDLTGTGNIDGDLTFIGETTPVNPPSGSVTLFVDSADGHTKQIDSTGTVIDLTDGATGGVVSVNGQTGTVVLVPSDIAYTPSNAADWVSSPTDEQQALDDLAATKAYGNNLSAAITLADNTATPTTFLSFPKTLINNSIIQYSISRNGDFRTGTLYIANNSTIASLADNSVETADLGIEITATISGANVLVQFTSTSTGFNASLKTITQQWN